MKKILVILFSCIAIFSCTEEKLLIFEETDSVFFDLRPYILPNNTDAEAYKNTGDFLFALEVVQDTVVYIRVNVAGRLAPIDREYDVYVDPSSSLREGVDYDFVNQPFVIPANKASDSIRVRLYRTPSMKDTTLVLKLQLRRNETFNVDMPYVKESSKSDSLVSTLNYTLLVSDFYKTPGFWTSPVTGAMALATLGEPSLKKVQVLCFLFSMEMSEFENPDMGAGGRFVAGNVIYMSKVLHNYLSYQKSIGQTVYDENENELTSGPMGSMP
ncbi:hypothetical protein AwDysgo_18580 [Bacteroidales bacterium]|nr:hypothetical protein AwDysgo_18580 [Bacteroidales bacterium]